MKMIYRTLLALALAGSGFAAQPIETLTDPQKAATRTALGLGTAATADASTNGGANKVLQMDANGDLRFSGSAPTGTAAAIGGVFFQDLERAWFLNTSRTAGASVWFNTVDYPGGGEFQIASPHRIAFGMGVNGAFQIGT